MIEVEATKKLFDAIKRGVNVILSRDGEKLLCDHGVCLEIADILGLTELRFPNTNRKFIAFSKAGYAVIEPISLVIKNMGLNPDQELIAPAGEWCVTREKLCKKILDSLDEESFVKEFLESKWYCEVDLEFFDAYYDELR